MSQKCYILVVIGQVPTLFYHLNDVSVNSMSMFICAKLDELKMYVYTAKHTNHTGFSNSGSELIISGTDPQRKVTLSITCSLCLVTVMVGSILGFPCAGCNIPHYLSF